MTISNDPAKNSANSSNSVNNAFLSELEQALEHSADADWLTTHSPLASPYFIGNFLRDGRNTEATTLRGAVLQRALRDAAAMLRDDQQRLLRLSFFERKPNANANNIATALGWSRAAYYRHRAAAIQDLARQLNQAIVPPLHPEQPRPTRMIGRADVLATCLLALRQKQTVAITGGGGMGKTTLGAALAAQWGGSVPERPSRIFWFTLRPGLNDQLATYVFALGHFLRGLGAPNTWQQLVADQGRVNLTFLLGLLRHDLATLADAPPLLILDEVDLLRRELNEHAQLLHLLDELRGLAPMALIGQKLVIEPHQHVVLAGLSVDETKLLLAETGPTQDADWQHLHRATRGNPAMLALLGTAPASDFLQDLKTAPSMELLLERIWRRLSAGEQHMLMTLSVFQAHAPQDAWPDEQHVIEQLIAHHLVSEDLHGGIQPLPFVREFVLARIPPDVQTTLHLHAASIHEVRGEYTLAAHHYLAGQQPAMAVWVWFNHREQEIQRGHAHTARVMFRLVTQSSLAHEEDRRALALLRAELHKLQGQAQEMEDELRAISWPEDHAASVYVHKLQGDALEMRGQLEQALQHYRQALQAFGDSAQLEATRLHARMSYIYRSRYHDIDQARQAALHAQFTAEIFRGNVEEGDGNYNMARMHHLAALSLAETMMNSDESVADSYTNLGRISWRLGNAAESVDHLQKAIQYDQQRGNTISLLHDRQNLSAAYIVAGDYEAALGQVELGMNLAEKLNHAYLIAGFAVNAGEACFHLNRLDEAEGYAMRALQQEENAMQPYALTVLGQVQHARGQLTQGVATLCAAIDAAQHIQDRFAEAPAWRALAAAYLAQQRNEEALQAFDKAINQFQDLGLAHEVNATERLQANSSSPHAP